LSAYGLGLADVVEEIEEPVVNELNDSFMKEVETKFITMIKENYLNLKDLGFAEEQIHNCKNNIDMTEYI
jgi:N-methylhydantoinase A/oxoprolinase/acetone carboxylase beta subunit